MKNEAQVSYTSVSTVEPEQALPAERHRWTGWRGTTALGSLAAGAVCLVNLGILIWTVTRFSLQDGVATVFNGSCDEVKRVSLWAHLGINIMSSILLAVSNSGMQCLVAPIREEIDHQHAQGKYLDIGVHSFRNMVAVRLGRFFLWALLGLSSLPLHLLYNSIVFEIVSGNDYVFITVGRHFETGGFWNHTRAECFDPNTNGAAIELIAEMQSNVADLVRLKNAACMQAYGSSGVQSRYGNVLVVPSTSTPDNVLNFWPVEMASGLGNN